MSVAFFFLTQGIHEPSGPSKEYYLLEQLVDMVISPYLSNYLYMSHRDSASGKNLLYTRVSHITPLMSNRQDQKICLINQ